MSPISICLPQHQGLTNNYKKAGSSSQEKSIKKQKLSKIKNKDIINKTLKEHDIYVKNISHNTFTVEVNKNT